MESPEHPPAPQDLVRHAGFLRALARGVGAGAEQAEDVLQDTWVAALKRAPARRDSLRPWLARVTRSLTLNARRGESRRAARERDAARAENEAAGPPEEVLASIEVSRALFAQVLALREPYRSAVFLRYYEGLAPRAIAARLGLPIKTVKTRLARALAELRARMDVDHEGSRARWLSALAPLALGHTTGPLAAVGGGMMGGALMLKKISIVVAAAVLAGLAWWGLGGPGLEPATRAAADRALPTPLVDAGGATADSVQIVATQPEGDARAPGASLPAQAPATGALVVSVRWEDGAPAVGIALEARCSQDPAPREEPFLARTDSEGRARFEALFPGGVRVVADRGARGRAEVVAGEERTLTLELPRGSVVVGRVVDPQDDPVVGAHVWVEGQSLQHAVARTGADGGFRIEGLDLDATVGACADGFAPSLAFQVREMPAEQGGPREVTLELARAGGTVEGRVLDPEGLPVAGARVRVGSTVRAYAPRNFGSPAFQPRAVPVETDAQGRFTALGSLPAGTAPVIVVARGWPLWTGSSEVQETGRTWIEVRLVPGATVEGTVVDDDGRPVAEATIALAGADQRHRDSVTPEARSDEAGHFSLTWLAAGERHIVALGPHARWELGRAEARVTCVPGGTSTVVLRLDPEPSIRGRIVDGQGQPLAGWSVWAETDRNAVVHGRIGRADGGGRFLIPNLEESRPYRVCVGAPGESPLPPRARSAEVAARAREVLVVVEDTLAADGGVRGRLLDAQGHVPENVDLVLNAEGSSSGSFVEVDAESGRFEHGRMLPGRYRLRVIDDHRAVLETEVFEVPPGGTHDAGLLQLLARGRLEVTIEGASLDELLQRPEIVARDFMSREELFREDGLLRSPELESGTWLLRVRLADHWVRDRDVEVAPGDPTRVELEALPGRRVGVAFLRDDLDAAWDRLSVRISAGQELALWEEIERSSFEEVKAGRLHTFVLPDGEYSLFAFTDGGQRGSGTLRVDDSLGEEPALLVHLR